MALFFPGHTLCALQSAHRRVRRSHRLASLPATHSEFDPLYDACVHRSCLGSWTRKDAFVEHHNMLVDTLAAGRVSRLVINADGNVSHEVDAWCFRNPR